MLGVRDLVRKLQRLIEDGFSNLWVEGEVSGLRVPSSGHIYFDLVEEDAKLPAVMFRGRTGGRRPNCLRDGNRVRLHGRLTIYPRSGRYQILVDRAEPAGLGDLLVALEELKGRLRAEGLFDPVRKRPLPFLPKVVGVVTSPTGAAIRDILRTLARRFPARVLIAPARVQGKGAAAEIARGVRLLDRLPEVEVIVVGRGGGSFEDLFCFNEEEVVRAIAEAETPIVSAVGHEVDLLLSDLAADARAATPTAAAELVVPDRAELAARLAELRVRLGRRARRRLDEARSVLELRRRGLRDPARGIELRRQRLDELGQRLERRARTRLRTLSVQLSGTRRHLGGLHPAERLRHGRQRVGQLRERLGRASTAGLATRERALDHLVRQLRHLSPDAHLFRGYALVHKDGDLLRTTENVAPEDRLRITLWRGVLGARVEDVHDDRFGGAPDSGDLG